MTSQTRFVLKAISYLGLAMSILPAFLVFGDVVSRGTYLWLMILGMAMWFGTASFWVRRDQVSS